MRRIDIRRDVERVASAEARLDAIRVCPACRDDLYTTEYGCPRCKYGRPGLVARSPALVCGLVAGGVVVLGVVGLFTVGTVAKQVPWVHAMLFGMSVLFSGAGTYALCRPKGLPLAQSAGADAWGQQQWGPTRPSTEKEGRRFGAIMLTVGIAMTLLGVFIGTFTG
jgi:hypothetical protein